MFRHHLLQRVLAALALGIWQTGTALAAPTITIMPSPVVVSPGKSLQLRAEVHGPSDYRVKWILQGPMVGGGDAGTLTEDGIYTAPASLPIGPIRVVVQVSLGEWNLPVAAASVPVHLVPEGAVPPPVAPPPPPPPMPFAAQPSAGAESPDSTPAQAPGD